MTQTDTASRARAHPPRGENFPLVGLFAPSEKARAIKAFYAFARTADDVADRADLSPQAKLDRLADMEWGLEGGPDRTGRTLRNAVGEGPGLQAARDLLGAFRQDAKGKVYADLDDLRAYCRMSADPVGRFLLSLYEEAQTTHDPSDALCTALQILNHLQDIREDAATLDRVYLPADWMAEAGVARADLTAAGSTPALRRVIDRALDECDGLLRRAAPLPGLIRARSLRGQATATLHLAGTLARRLRRGDPLARRIAPTRFDFARAALRGAGAAARP
ncbi:squalene/phytoene synthase family protein [Jannaschia sp. LMIT008]|uniref:squalene/phytoene synthase family protein n=1 Tax=Jannaschia maritima TaxID=3032585 RepID=UPI002810C6FB|nr:squalene/phytoene synthase family protein [Jannaschia sp. LMIT008]